MTHDMVVRNSGQAWRRSGAMGGGRAALAAKTAKEGIAITMLCRAQYVSRSL